MKREGATAEIGSVEHEFSRASLPQRHSRNLSEKRRFFHTAPDKRKREKEREREGKRERKRQKEREREGKRKKERERERKREKEKIRGDIKRR